MEPATLHELVVVAVNTAGTYPIGPGDRVAPLRRGEREWQRGRRQRPLGKENPPPERPPAEPEGEPGEQRPRRVDILA